MLSRCISIVSEESITNKSAGGLSLMLKMTLCVELAFIPCDLNFYIIHFLFLNFTFLHIIDFMFLYATITILWLG